MTKTKLFKPKGSRFWKLFVENDDTNNIDISKTEIAFIPKRRQLMINNFDATYIYDFVLQAWMRGHELGTGGITTTNMVLDQNEDLTFIRNNNNDAVVEKWQETPQSHTDANAGEAFTYTTRNMDFDEPAVRKKLYN